MNEDKLLRNVSIGIITETHLGGLVTHVSARPLRALEYSILSQTEKWCQLLVKLAIPLLCGQPHVVLQSLSFPHASLWYVGLYGYWVHEQSLEGESRGGKQTTLT